MIHELIVVLGLFALADIVFTAYRLRKAINSFSYSQVELNNYPSVSVIRPIKGLDVGAEENFKAALNTGYPGEVETIFIFDDQDDPGYEVAKRVIAQHIMTGARGTARVVTSGSPPKGRTGKLHAMIIGEKMAKNDLIAFSDSDTRPDSNVLRTLVETLINTKGAGSSFAPVVINQPAQKTGDVFYALLQNALYSPWAMLAAGKDKELPFIMGQYMVFTRECLEAIGGVQCAEGQLVDDMYIGKIVAEKGYKNIINSYPLHIFTGGLSLKEFIPIYKKWFHFSKNGLPMSFLWRQWLFCGEFYLSLALLILGVYNSLWLMAGVALVALVTFVAVLLTTHVKYGGTPIGRKFSWAPILMLIMAPGILVSNKLNRKVNWRGRTYTVNKSASLEVK